MRNYHNIFWTKYYELKFRPKKDVNDTVYMFHSIDDGKTDTKSFVSNKSSFAKFLENEISDRTPCALSELFSDSKEKRFALTFDDVFENVYTNAYPILKKLGIPFTLFVSSGFIGKEGYLTAEQLKEIASDALCTVGAHTVNHPLLRRAKNSYEEIVRSKAELEGILGKEVKYFAYPYGSVYACSGKNIRQAKKAGFEAAFSTLRGVLPSNKNAYRFFLPRNNGDHLVKKLEERKI